MTSGAVVVVDDVRNGVGGGNLATLIRIRASDVAHLLAAAWCEWLAEHITEHLRTIMSGSVDDLEAVERTGL